jgi:hypothetical protein
MSDLMEALTALRDARPDYEEAESYYEGRAEERFASAFMKQVLGGSRDFKVNLACRPVDAVLDRLEIAAVTTEPEDGTAIFERDVWKANELDIEAPDIHQAACMYGDAYLFAWEAEPDDDEDDDEPDTVPETIAAADDAEQSGPTGVDVFYNSPLIARIIYDIEHPRRKRLAIKSWCVTDDEGGERVRANLYYRRRIEKYISKAKTEAEKDEDFEAFIDEHTDANGVMKNPYGAIPFFHFRTASPYGKPVHKNAFGPQDALTKLITNQMAAGDFAVLPQRYGLVEGKASTDDDIDWDEDDETDPEEKQSSLVSAPGTLWALRNYKAVGQFAPADVENFLKPIGMHVRFMSAVTSTPLRWFDPSGDVPSGESIRADEAPLNKRIQKIGLRFGSAWRQFGAFALEILGYRGYVVTVRWKSPQTVEDLDFWLMVKAKQEAGVPVRVTLMEAGYTEAQVTEWGYTEENPDGPGQLDEFINPPADDAGGEGG